MSLLLQDTLVISPSTVEHIEGEIADVNDRVDLIEASSDCADVVGTKAELDSYDKSKLTDKAVIKVLQDESQANAQTYYRYSKSSNSFTLIGELGPFYTKAESDNIEEQIRQDFAAADTTLQNNIDAEETRATGVENQLRTDLTTETTRATGKETELNTAITTHTSNTSNPHSVTKAQVGLGNVDNTSDANKPISTATQTALDSKVDKTDTENQVYVTDSSGNQTTARYSIPATASSIVKRTTTGQITVQETPSANTDATSKKYVDDLGNTKVDKVTISTTTGTVTLADNTIFNGGELSTLTITNPSSLAVDFGCQVNFTSGATPTVVTASNIVWLGDNVNETVGFVPRVNCRYIIDFTYDGNNIRGYVQGVSL